MKQVQHLFWDFDGTLVDTYPNLVRYMSLALSDFGITADPVEILEKMMENIPYALDYYTKKYDLMVTSGSDYHEIEDALCGKIWNDLNDNFTPKRILVIQMK